MISTYLWSILWSSVTHIFRSCELSHGVDCKTFNLTKLGTLFVSRSSLSNKYRLIHGHFHIGLLIIPRPPYWPETESRFNMGRGMITRPIWKSPCIKLFITYFRHLEKRHPYWPETKARPILARAIWASKWK